MRKRVCEGASGRDATEQTGYKLQYTWILAYGILTQCCTGSQKQYLLTAGVLVSIYCISNQCG